MKRRAIAPFLLAALAASSCGRGVIPTAPTPVASTPPPSAPPVLPPGPTPAARLVVSDFSVRVLPPGYSAQARFTLTEVGGVSGALIRSVTVFNPLGSDTTGETCWRTPIHVEAGSTLDAFGARGASLSYCAPYFDGPIYDSLSLTVTFVDDQGVTGTSSATTNTIVRSGG